MSSMMYVRSSNPQNVEVVNLELVTFHSTADKLRMPKEGDNLNQFTIIFQWGTAWLEWRYDSKKARDYDYAAILRVSNTERLDGKPLDELTAKGKRTSPSKEIAKA